MKKIAEQYIRFTRTEQKGIATILLLLFVLVIVRLSIQFFVSSPEIDSKTVVLASQKVKEQQRTVKKILPAERLNLNTADSLQLVALPGIGKGLAHRILQRRRELGKFSNMDEVLAVYKFRKDTKKMLMEHTFVE